MQPIPIRNSTRTKPYRLDRIPIQRIYPHEDLRPSWLCWLIAIAATFVPTIAALWFVFQIIAPRIEAVTRGMP